MHALIDVLAAFAVVWGVDRAPQLWAAIRAFAERLANSWREWEFGAG
jgi:hypothetical protein